jgi:hypothetical protein
MLTYHSVVVFVADIIKQKRFYTEVLRQEIDLDLGSCIIFKCGISLWNPPMDHIISTKSDKASRVLENKHMELCFETDQFDTVVKELKNNDIMLLHDVFEESWGQLTIRFYDPENNLVEIGETMPSFIYRLHKNGMSLTQIFKKTSVPEVLIKKYLNEKSVK